MTQLIIIGYGGHAKVIEDCVNKSTEHVLIGYIDLEDQGNHLKYLGPDEKMISVMEKYPNAQYVIGIGDIQLRQKIIRYYEQRGVSFATVIHTSAVVSDRAEIGSGSVVFPMAVVNPGCKIGKHAIINTGAIVEHDNMLGNNVHIAPQAVTGGQVAIGDNTLIGLGSSVRNNIKIGESCIVGCGSVVIDNISNSSLVYGVPAKPRSVSG